MRYLINFSYNGNYFYGYQVQENNKTVEGEIEKALSKILNEKINTIGSSRTDRYVHSYDSYCHFDSERVLDTDKLLYSLNSIIDKAIYIKSIVISDIHARYDVKEKEYVYKINMGRYNPIDKDYVLQYCKVIDISTLDKFIKYVGGKHDFRSFTSDKDNNNYVREVNIKYSIYDDILSISVSSSGFLRYMIRNIIGLLLDINDGKKKIEDINEIFEDRTRTALGTCAPAYALYLVKTEY